MGGTGPNLLFACSDYTPFEAKVVIAGFYNRPRRNGIFGLDSSRSSPLVTLGTIVPISPFVLVYLSRSGPYVRFKSICPVLVHMCGSSPFVPFWSICPVQVHLSRSGPFVPFKSIRPVLVYSSLDFSTYQVLLSLFTIFYF